MTPRPGIRPRARAAAVAGLRWLSSPVGSVVSVRTTSPHVVLTFDDGPDPVVTPPLLDRLARAEASATFFLLMGRVHRNPALVREIKSAGHEIALHGVDHRRLTDFSARDVLERTRAARLDLEDVVGERVRWFRPPYGAQTPSTYVAVRRAGLEVVLWGPSLWDWHDAPESERLERALRGLRPGAIVLGHDGLADARDGEVAPVATHLDRATWAASMLQVYRERGLSGRSLGAAAAGGRLVRRGHFVRGAAAGRVRP